MAAKTPLEFLNTCEAGRFVSILGEVFERAPWVAERALAARPYATVEGLHAAMMAAVRAAPRAAQLAFVRSHPELAGKVARAGNMAAASRAEQGSLGLDRLGEDEFARFSALNGAYSEKFGFPFIICVRRHTRDSILNNFARRLENDADKEFAAALEEIGFITRLRLVAGIEGPGQPKTDGRLTTHVLDLVRGRPAQGVKIALYEIGASAHGLIVTRMTNAGGRTDEPLIAGQPLRIGLYEFQFAIGDYFATQTSPRDGAPFLDVVPVRFGIAEPEGHYHVPLLATPWSYATYRGR